MSDPTHFLAPTFNFRVTLRLDDAGAQSGRADDPQSRLGDGGFQECSGLEIEMDAQELPEGGRNDGVARLVGRGKYTPIVLKRGMFYPPEGKVNSEIWRWIQSVLSGTRPVVRYNGSIDVLDRRGEDDEPRTLATWTFTRALPQKVRGPELNARTGEIAIEELTLVHEGLRFEP